MKTTKVKVHVLIQGERGSGKTTVLNACENTLEKHLMRELKEQVTEGLGYKISSMEIDDGTEAEIEFEVEFVVP